jgi:hypothetical protein
MSVSIELANGIYPIDQRVHITDEAKALDDFLDTIAKRGVDLSQIRGHLINAGGE